jgi:hypothetical protein
MTSHKEDRVRSRVWRICLDSKYADEFCKWMEDSTSKYEPHGLQVLFKVTPNRKNEVYIYLLYLKSTYEPKVTQCLNVAKKLLGLDLEFNLVKCTFPTLKKKVADTATQYNINSDYVWDDKAETDSQANAADEQQEFYEQDNAGNNANLKKSENIILTTKSNIVEHPNGSDIPDDDSVITDLTEYQLHQLLAKARFPFFSLIDYAENMMALKNRDDLESLRGTLQDFEIKLKTFNTNTYFRKGPFLDCVIARAFEFAKKSSNELLLGEPGEDKATVQINPKVKVFLAIITKYHIPYASIFKFFVNEGQKKGWEFLNNKFVKEILLLQESNLANRRPGLFHKEYSRSKVIQAIQGLDHSWPDEFWTHEDFVQSDVFFTEPSSKLIEVRNQSEVEDGRPDTAEKRVDLHDISRDEPDKKKIHTDKL